MTTKRKKIVAMGILISIVAVAALAIPGMKTYKRVMGVSESASYETAIAEEKQSAAQSIAQSIANNKKESEEQSQSVAESIAITVPTLSAQEQDLLNDLYTQISNRNLESVARILLEKQEDLENLCDKTFEGRTYLFDGRGVRLMPKKGQNADGIVLKASNTIFYGSFVNGSINGHGIALTAYNLDAPRFDYSEGEWSNGLMEGSGTIGYSYLAPSPSDDSISSYKTGNFVHDNMDGDFTYGVNERDGAQVVFTLRASNGRTVIDNRWKWDSDAKAYALKESTSTNPEEKAKYTLTKEQSSEVRWSNPVPFMN